MLRQERLVSWRYVYLFMVTAVTRNKYERGKGKTRMERTWLFITAALSAALSLDRGQRNRAIPRRFVFVPLSRIRRFDSFVHSSIDE